MSYEWIGPALTYAIPLLVFLIIIVIVVWQRKKRNAARARRAALSGKFDTKAPTNKVE